MLSAGTPNSRARHGRESTPHKRTGGSPKALARPLLEYVRETPHFDNSNAHRPIRTHNFRERTTVFPSAHFRYGIPLCFCPLKRNGGQAGAIPEGIRAYARHVGRNCN